MFQQEYGYAITLVLVKVSQDSSHLTLDIRVNAYDDISSCSPATGGNSNSALSIFSQEFKRSNNRILTLQFSYLDDSLYTAPNSTYKSVCAENFVKTIGSRTKMLHFINRELTDDILNAFLTGSCEKLQSKPFSKNNLKVMERLCHLKLSAKAPEEQEIDIDEIHLYKANDDTLEFAFKENNMVQKEQITKADKHGKNQLATPEFLEIMVGLKNISLEAISKTTKKTLNYLFQLRCRALFTTIPSDEQLAPIANKTVSYYLFFQPPTVKELTLQFELKENPSLAKTKNYP